MENILITGVAGNIGSSLALSLIKKKYNVIGMDNLSTGSQNKLPIKSNNFKFFVGDVNNYNQLEKLFINTKFDFVFHLAAVVGVQRTTENPLDVLKDIDGIKNILHLAKSHNVKRIYYTSSSEVYGEPVELPLKEDTSPLNAKWPYAVVKNIGECYFRSYYQIHGLNYTIFRIFNTYGPNQSEDFVIPKFLSLAGCDKEIKIYGDGSQTRTFLYIDDNIDSILRCFEGKKYLNETINIGSDKQYSIYEIAKIIIKLCNSKSVIKFVSPLEVGDMSRRQPDISKLKNVKNNFIKIEDGIKLLLEFRKKFRHNE